MSCEEIESQILDYQENQLAPARRAEVEAHLAGCAGCRTFARQLRQLDAALSASVKVPALSAGFDQRLQGRIEAVPVVWTEAQRSERKRELEAEFAAGQARLNRGVFTLDTLREHLTWPALGVLAGWLVWRFTLPLTAHLPAQSLGGLNPSLLPWLAASAVFLAVSLAEVLPPRWKIPVFW
jgi:hypothetical protein